MVAGHLQEKKGFFYIVLSFTDETGKRKPKWISTGLPVKGNKRKAEIMLQEERRKYQSSVYHPDADMLFSDYLKYWLKLEKTQVETVTYAGYKTNIENRIAPYFAERHITLGKLKPIDIQEECRKLCGKSYYQSDYIYVNAIGEPIKPNYVTQHFALLLEKNGLRKITFHELRHSCASLLLSSGVSMKEIQEWLGHSNFSTTANIYAHLDSSAKEGTDQTMAGKLDISKTLSEAHRRGTKRIDERTAGRTA